MNIQANQFYREPWFGIVLTVLFFPAGVYVIFRFGSWQRHTKVWLSLGLSILCVIVWTIAGLAPASSNQSVGQSWLSTNKTTTVIPKTKLSFNVDNNGDVRLHGTTNLPDRSQLRVTISQKDLVLGDQVKVNHGAFTSSKLTSAGHPLPTGAYRVHLTNNSWTNQPQSVRTKLGSRGENLRGDETVKTGKSHQIDFTNTVNYQP
ncbi:hypothetical protein [Furfurilactobacillus curtus]|uniref:DUF4131 domain-containing protein n=1 Tax=Furfurilactobacillus curtus TaxID=1746200 RepID=A0ABQ5JLV9_9LACO